MLVSCACTSMTKAGKRNWPLQIRLMLRIGVPLTVPWLDKIDEPGESFILLRNDASIGPRHRANRKFQNFMLRRVSPSLTPGSI